MHGIECCIIHLFFKLFSFKHCVFAFICTSVNYKKFIGKKQQKNNNNKKYIYIYNVRVRRRIMYATLEAEGGPWPPQDLLPAPRSSPGIYLCISRSSRIFFLRLKRGTATNIYRIRRFTAE